MMRNKALLVAAITLGLPVSAMALGLGNVRLSSALNEPLDARIELLSVKPGEAEDIKATLATSAEFQRAGLERPFLLSKLRFRVEQDASGRVYVQLTTAQPLREPFLDFLIEINWPKGRLLREYTILLDPPVYGAAVSAGVKGPVVRAGTAGTVPPPAPQAESKQPVREPQAFSGDRYGPTGASDTLWSIASQVRPDASVTVQQMMMALLHANPDAFVGGNINALKAGEVLRIPSAEELGSVSRSEAIAETRRQNALWEESRQGVITTPRPMVETAGTPSEGKVIPGTGEEKRLEILSAGHAEAGSGAAGDTAALRKRMSLLEEQLDSKNQETTELASRLKQTEEIIENQTKLLELKDSELAALSAELDKAKAAPAVPEGSVVAVEAEKEPTPTDTEESEATAALGAEATPPESETEEPVKPSMEEGMSVTEGMPEETMPGEQAEGVNVAETPAEVEPAAPTEPVESAVAVPPKPVPLPQPARHLSWTDRLPFNPLLLGGGLGALILIGGGLIFMARRGKSGEAPVSGAAVAAAEEETVVAVDQEAETQTPEAAREETGEGPEESTQIAGPEGAGLEGKEEDPLAEVNVYLAYERFDQAAELVRKAIDEHPDQEDYYLKMVEIQYAAKDKDAFEREAAILRDKVGMDSPLMEKAAGWWQELSPDRDLFAKGGAGSEGLDETQTSLAAMGEEHAGTQELDLDAMQAEAADTQVGAELDFQATGDIDFDLGMSTEEQQEKPSGELDLDFSMETGEEKPEATESGGDLDLDLDLGFGPETGGEEENPESGAELDLDLGGEAEAESIAAEDLGVSGDQPLDLDFGEGEVPEGEGSRSGATELDLEVEPGGEEESLTESLNLEIGLGEEEPVADEAPRAAEDEGLDLDIGLGEEEPVSEEEPRAAEDEGLDLDIGLGEEEPVAKEEPRAAEDEGLDLEIGLGEEEPVAEEEAQAASEGPDLDMLLGEEEPPAEEEPHSGTAELDLDIDELGLEESPLQEEPEPASGEADLSVGLDETERTSGESPEAGAGGLDLDLGFAEEESSAAEETPSAEGGELDLDLGFGEESLGEPADAQNEGLDLDLGIEEEPASQKTGEAGEPALDLDLGFGEAEAAEEEAPEEPKGEGPEIDFDLDLGLEDEEPEKTLVLGREVTGEVDEVGTKLDLAQAYMDMGDTDGARGILEEVIKEGNDVQKAEALALLDKL